MTLSASRALLRRFLFVRLKSKTCLITGGGAGIGAATTKIFRQEGAEVFVVDAKAGPGVDFVADVSDPSLAAKALGKLQKLDVLVCNAAMRNYSALGDATPEEWQKVVSVNLLGAAHYV